ncbi:MAG: Nitrogen regulation protein NtrB (EC [uncultured Thiotrichaceae bacterium]|uniref:Sensory histidine kinase/phosphatase NtrB n=1 Tax=uncultured Thiotrichaceae bacterium TaxID=298394 RepID=A0A6S6U757_9GAMM|nr:MAG: Nitrogen regulation protein NtrB (EC [uncultured Thiotrichaceae bacterium]
MPNKTPNTPDILDSLLCGIIITDKALCIRYLNNSAEETLGKSFSQVNGEEITRFISYLGLKKRLNKILHGEQSYTNRATSFHIKDQGDVHLDFSISPKTDGDDITGIILEMKQIDRQLRIARDNDLMEVLDTNQTILRGMAHEIKNPLGGISGAAQLMAMDAQDDTAKECTQIILSETARLTSLVDELLGPANIPKKKLINVHEVLEHCRHVFSLKIGSNIRLSFDYDPSIPDIVADRDKMVQVILNILQNALNAIGDHEGNILIRSRILWKHTIHQTLHPYVASISITDDGPGIPDDIRGKIFYPMITGRAEGTGLGLSIAQTLITQHGGIIEVDSIPGKTTFSIILPLGKSE